MKSIVQRVENWLHTLFVALGIVATISGVAIVALVTTSITMRHVAHAPLRFTEELVGLLMTSAFFLALPLVTLRAEHVRVQILVVHLPSRIRRWVAVAAALFGIAFSVWFFWLCVPWFEFAFSRSITTEVGRLLMYPWMAVLPVSLLLTSIAFAVRIVNPEPSSVEARDNKRPGNIEISG